MSDVSIFSGRKRKPVPNLPGEAAPNPPAPNRDPRVVQFLEDFTAQQERMDYLTSELDSRDKEIDKLRTRIQLQQNELSSCQRARDEYQAGYAELKAQLAVLITSVEQNYQSFSHVADAALRSIRDSMKQAGVDPVDPADNKPTEGRLTDEQLEQLANRFAPDNRTTEKENV